MRSRPSYPGRGGFDRGFTLIELLTVIAIIGILAAIILPTISAVRAAGYAARTSSNLRQLQTASLLHATEHKGFLAPSTSTEGDGNWNPPWFATREFLVYLGVQGPWEGANSKDQSSGQLSWAWAERFPEVAKCGKPCSLSTDPARSDRNFTIAMNLSKASHSVDGTPFSSSSGYGLTTRGKIQQSKIKNPTMFITFMEGGDFILDFSTRLNWTGDNGAEVGGVAFRNNGNARVVYADGHVGSIKRNDILKDGPDLRRMFYFDYQ